MTPDQLSAICGVLVVLLGVSETLPYVRAIRANGWAQLIEAVIRAIAGAKARRR